MPLCFRQSFPAISQASGKGHCGKQACAHRELLTRSFESAVTGLGSEIVMRVPQTEQ
jgi:hypothetical protein